MNPHKTEGDLFTNHDLPPMLDHSLPPHHNPHDPTFSVPEMVLFRSYCSADSQSHSDDDNDNDDSISRSAAPQGCPNLPPQNPRLASYISPDPHISSQFYTFNADSHSLMVRCIRDGRLATPVEIRAATPRSVLKSWRAVWKDRNEDTAYLTAWKRIQDKLTCHFDPASGNHYLCFKNNSHQYVSHFDQWYDIVMSFHGDADLKHLGLKETIERIKQVWTVGAKFYGIPESYIRVCVSACPICNTDSASASRSKRRRFEYTESFDVPAKEVPHKLQQLAAKHKVVLCIRQKYIRYKPFMAEVKDYACHRAGEPASKRSRMLKREPYQSKRCGCGFRIRAIVPITNYNEKDKTFVYQEEGIAVFKLYAVHTGHEPGPMDGNARIMHRVIGHKGGFMMNQNSTYGMGEDLESEDFGLLGKQGGDLRFSILQQLHDVKSELMMLEGRIGKLPEHLLCSASQELYDVLNKIKSVGEEGIGRSMGLLSDKSQSNDILVGENDLSNWSNHRHDQLYGDGKDTELIEDDDDSFERTLGDVVPWDQMRAECRSPRDLLSESCKPDKWLKCSDFDEKSIILNCEDTKLTKPIRHDESIVTDVGLVGIQVDSFYQDNAKWYDSPCGLDSSTDCAGNGFRHEEII